MCVRDFRSFPQEPDKSFIRKTQNTGTKYKYHSYL
jgi:hypothetical protein